MKTLNNLIALPIKASLKFKKIAIEVSGSFWFAPVVMVVVATVLALSFSPFTHEKLTLVSILKLNDLAASQSMTSLVASSVISVISIAFSMTLVALVMASNQFGPRIIRSFMESKKTQLTLGLFTSTYVYSLILSAALNEENLNAYLSYHGDAFIGYPVLAVFISALTCVIALIFFIHHVATSIQADNVVEHIAKSLMKDIKQLQERHSKNASYDKLKLKNQSQFAEKKDYSFSYDVFANEAGYVQAIEYPHLVEIAKKADGFIQLNTRAGKHLLVNAPVATLFSNKADVNIRKIKAEQFIETGDKRTPLQDPEYAISQLVEIALRALSPSMDDPHTANNCIDKIACALGSFHSDNLPASLVVDENDTARLLTRDESFDDIFANAFTQIRQSAVLRPAVVCHLLDTFKSLLDSANNGCDTSHLEKPILIQTEALKELFEKRTELHCKTDVEAINSRLALLLGQRIGA